MQKERQRQTISRGDAGTQREPPNTAQRHLTQRREDAEKGRNRCTAAPPQGCLAQRTPRAQRRATSGGTTTPHQGILAPLGMSSFAATPLWRTTRDKLRRRDAEKGKIAIVERVLKQTGGNVSQAAKLLGIHRTKVYRILAQGEKAQNL